jgi:GxxExxY protein
MVEIYAHADITGKIIGALYQVYNEMGFGYQEKYYYRAIKNKLLELGFKVDEQLLASIVVAGKIIGRYYLDFLVDGVVVLEIKVADRVYPQHVRQVIGYLKAKNLKVGLVGVISPRGIIIKRVVN